MAAYTYDYRRSYLLDTDAKVKWANDLPKEAVAGRPWKLGDHCYYRPVQEPQTDYGCWGGY